MLCNEPANQLLLKTPLVGSLSCLLRQSILVVDLKRALPIMSTKFAQHVDLVFFDALRIDIQVVVEFAKAAQLSHALRTLFREVNIARCDTWFLVHRH